MRLRGALAAINYYIKKNLPLLEDIASSQVKADWCRRGAIDDGTTAYSEFRKQLSDFFHGAYDCGLVPSNYRDTYDSIGIEDMYTRTPRDLELKGLSIDQVISVIAMQFRDDHFDNGVLFRHYVADGIMLPYMRELADRLA